MSPDNALDDRQPEACSASLSRDGHVGLIEALEDIGGLILRNANPVVLHLNPYLVAIPAHVNVHDWGNAFTEITSGIAEEIDEDLSDTFRIEFETLGLWIDGTRHLELKPCLDKLCRLVKEALQKPPCQAGWNKNVLFGFS